MTWVLFRMVRQPIRQTGVSTRTGTSMPTSPTGLAPHFVCPRGLLLCPSIALCVPSVVAKRMRNVGGLNLRRCILQDGGQLRGDGHPQASFVRNVSAEVMALTRTRIFISIHPKIDLLCGREAVRIAVGSFAAGLLVPPEFTFQVSGASPAESSSGAGRRGLGS